MNASHAAICMSIIFCSITCRGASLSMKRRQIRRTISRFFAWWKLSKFSWYCSTASYNKTADKDMSKSNYFSSYTHAFGSSTCVCSINSSHKHLVLQNIILTSNQEGHGCFYYILSAEHNCSGIWRPKSENAGMLSFDALSLNLVPVYLIWALKKYCP